MRGFTHRASADTKYLVPWNIPNPNIDWQVWKLFCKARKNILINGPMWKAEDLKALPKFNKDDFMTSNRWLDAFVSQQISAVRVQKFSWRPLGNRRASYPVFVMSTPSEIYNCDKTCIFFWAIPSRCFVWKDKALVGPRC